MNPIHDFTVIFILILSLKTSVMYSSSTYQERLSDKRKKKDNGKKNTMKMWIYEEDNQDWLDKFREGWDLGGGSNMDVS